MGLFFSKYQYLEYSNNIQETFPIFVDENQRYFEKKDGFGGAINGDAFYFYKKYPFSRNHYRTVLYGEIIDDHTIRYRYGKLIWPQVITLLVSLGLFLGLVLAILLYLYKRDPLILLWCALVVIICPILIAHAFIRREGENEILYNHLRTICGPITITDKEL